ncbi:MAG: ammonium transporter [Geminicoccaceae bacterium]
MRITSLIRVLLPIFLLIASATMVMAQDTPPAPDAPAASVEATPATPTPVLDTGNTAWMLVSSAFVLMMSIPGLALFYAGMVRKKNVLSVLMQVFATVSLLSLVWMIVGYSLAFGEGGAYIGDLSKAFMNGVGVTSLSGTIPESVFSMFQMTFFIITPALMVGAFVDRMRFGPMLLFMVVWSLVVYAPIAHWVWAPTGFLFGEGVLDFAGGTVVHINAGIGGLVACIMVGKRVGFGNEHMAPHNLTLTLIGTSLLWVGWFGFNAGSALAADGRAGMAFFATHIGSASAAIAWMLVEWVAKGKPSVLGIASGAVAGLVAITPAAGFVLPNGALAIGIAAGVICFWSATSLKHMLGYDDSLDVFGVHGVGGIVGALLTGVFATSAVGGSAASGLIDGNSAQLLIQVKGVLYTVVWCGVASFVMLKLLDLVIGLRVDRDSEREGLDLALHGESVA